MAGTDLVPAPDGSDRLPPACILSHSHSWVATLLSPSHPQQPGSIEAVVHEAVQRTHRVADGRKHGAHGPLLFALGRVHFVLVAVELTHHALSEWAMGKQTAGQADESKIPQANESKILLLCLAVVTTIAGAWCVRAMKMKACAHLVARLDDLGLLRFLGAALLCLGVGLAAPALDLRKAFVLGLGSCSSLLACLLGGLGGLGLVSFWKRTLFTGLLAISVCVLSAIGCSIIARP